MSSMISHVILPGLGAVCPECFSRGYVGAMPLVIPETYTFGIAQPSAELEWDVEAARALIQARPRAAQLLDPAWLLSWLVERSRFTLDHLDHIPADKLDEPGILVEIMAGPPGRAPEPFRMLIDGTHRAARRLMESRACWAYLLTEAEQRSVCTYRREGRTTESTYRREGRTTAGTGHYRKRRRYPDRLRRRNRRCLSSTFRSGPCVRAAPRCASARWMRSTR